MVRPNLTVISWYWEAHERHCVLSKVSLCCTHFRANYLQLVSPNVVSRVNPCPDTGVTRNLSTCNPYLPTQQQPKRTYPGADWLDYHLVFFSALFIVGEVPPLAPSCPNRKSLFAETHEANNNTSFIILKSSCIKTVSNKSYTSHTLVPVYALMPHHESGIARF